MKGKTSKILPLALALAALTLNLCIVQEVQAGSWVTNGPMITARGDHTATLLADGNVLVTGGSEIGGDPSSTELYDPATGMWKTAGNMTTQRYYHSATLLPNGKVLVVGGYYGGWLSAAELYDPTTGTWTLTGALATARAGHSATLLPDGRVLVA